MHTQLSEKKLVKLEATKEACDFFAKQNERELFLLAYNLHMKTCCKLLFELQMTENSALRNTHLKDTILRFRQSLNVTDLIALGWMKTVYYSLAALCPHPMLLKVTL